VIIVDEIVSADGFASRADGDIDWFLEVDGIVETVGSPERMSRVSAVLLGAQTYREFRDYWPAQDPASAVNRLPKHVASRTLVAAPWGDLPPAELERDDPASVVRRLEQRYDGDLIVWGSLTLAASLFDAGLVDELWLRVVPKALGGGRGFLPDRDIVFSDVEMVGHVGGWSTVRYVVDRRS
jgi:dihydrofolate reductase